MKKIMKKVLSLALVVALAIAPMTVMASGSGTQDDPAALAVDGTTNTCTVEEFGHFWYTFQSETSGTLSFEPVGDDVWLEFFRGAVDMNGYMGGADFPCEAENPYILTVAANTLYIIDAKTSSMTAGEVSFTATFAEGASLEGDSMETAINVTGQSSLSVPANSTKYFYVTGAYSYGSEYTLSVDGGMAAGMGNGITVTSFMNSQQVATATDAAQASILAIGMMANGGSVYFSVTNPSLYDYETVYFSIVDGAPSGGGLGSYNEPDALELGDNQYITLDGNEYWYSWTAEESGKLTITMNNMLSSDGWTYQVDGLSPYSTGWDEYDKNVCEISLGAGESALFGIWVPKWLEEEEAYEPYEAGSGTIYFSASFTAGPIDDDNNYDDDDDDSDNSGVTGDEINENYYYKYQELTVGTNDIMPMFGYPTTLYTFVPTEAGEYLVTIDEQGATLGYYGSNEWYPFDYTETKTSSLTLEAAEANAPMLIGVSDAMIATVTITRVGNLEDEGGYDEIEYENVVTPEEFTFPGVADQLLDSYVDTFDDVVDTAVLGDDGYYHLNSANGPVLFANLSDEVMSLVNAQSYGQLSAVIYDNDVPVSETNFYNAFEEYVACADTESIEGATLYPLTEDLMLIFQLVGEDKSWYGENGFVGGTGEDAWMFACYYDEAITSLAPATEGPSTGGTTGGSTTAPNGTQESPKTGDNASIAVWAIAMVVAAGAAFVVAESKRRAR